MFLSVWKWLRMLFNTLKMYQKIIRCVDLYSYITLLKPNPTHLIFLSILRPNLHLWACFLKSLKGSPDSKTFRWCCIDIRVSCMNAIYKHSKYMCIYMVYMVLLYYYFVILILCFRISFLSLVFWLKVDNTDELV